MHMSERERKAPLSGMRTGKGEKKVEGDRRAGGMEEWTMEER